MRKKIIKRSLLIVAVLGVVSCISNKMKEMHDMTTADVTGKSAKRSVASDYTMSSELMAYLQQDPFSKDGYDHNTDGQYQNRSFQFGGALSPEEHVKELAGREIWFKSAPNERFHTYFFSQRINAPIAWNRVLNAKDHNVRFARWGLINDPDCCLPGKECRDRGMKFNGRDVTIQDTYGWEYCIGDQELLNSLKAGGPAWKDPACEHPIIKEADRFDNKPRENRCELAFGNATGAVGYRKFPNPRFNANAWAKVGGWEGFEKRMTEAEIDSSIEPPFRVGKSCASCHAAFDPLNTPKGMDLANPSWKNIKGETGNQYLNGSAILGSGVKHNTLEYQMFVHARAGAVDTSAVPIDFVNNPGTINALINIPQRPTFTDNVTRWMNVDGCSGDKCQTITYPDQRKKYWEHVENQPMQVFHILKDGSDSVGADLAVQRVYVNIGMCAEQCWGNHLTDVRELDSSRRGFGQSPFQVAQCRRDCASWRANEDRVGDVLTYILSRRPTDLKDVAVKSVPPEERDQALAKFLNKRYQVPENVDLVGQGRKIFATNCANCHSSQNENKDDLGTPEDFTQKDFMTLASLGNGEKLRLDWMGNDKSTRADIVGTYRCRSLHSNHMKGHVWEQFSSDTYKGKETVYSDARGNRLSGGRGHYRNISLLNVWAHAPFGHANAIGPEICGRLPSDPKLNPWRTTVEMNIQGQEPNQVEATSRFVCEEGFDPSMEGRLKLFDLSVNEILTPSSDRRKKVGLMDESIRFPLGFKLNLFNYSTPLFLEFPKGTPTNAFTSLDIKGLAKDLLDAMPYYVAYAKATGAAQENAKNAFNDFWKQRVPDPSAADELAKTSFATFETFKEMAKKKDPKVFEQYMASIRSGNNSRLKTYFRYYSNCDAYYENLGHDFGTQLSQADKTALKAFLATL